MKYISGQFVKDVINFSKILTPLPLRHHLYKISLLNKIIFWQTPLPLDWWRLIWNAPYTNLTIFWLPLYIAHKYEYDQDNGFCPYITSGQIGFKKSQYKNVGDLPC